MSLLTTLKEDMKTAMKARQSERLTTIRMLMAALKNKQIDKSGADLSEDEEIAFLATEAKRRRESITAYEDAGREDLAATERAELEVISHYLPEPLTEGEVRAIVEQVIADTGATSKKQMGQVMGRVMPQVKGRFDGAAVKPIVLGLLGD